LNVIRSIRLRLGRNASYANDEGPSLYTISAMIETRHFQESFVRSAGESKCIPAVAQRKIRVVVPDLAVTAGPADHYPFGVYWPKGVSRTNMRI